MRAAVRLAALIATAAILCGGCATSRPVAAPAADGRPLSDALARLRAALSEDPVPAAVRKRSSIARSPSSNRIGDATRPAVPPHPFPRGLDPLAPLYRPPDRRLSLQPLLDVPRPSPGTGVVPRRGRPAGRDPLGTADPLRRIDPVSGRDPLGRPDPTGGVDIDVTPPPSGLGDGR